MGADFSCWRHVAFWPACRRLVGPKLITIGMVLPAPRTGVFRLTGIPPADLPPTATTPTFYPLDNSTRIANYNNLSGALIWPRCSLTPVPDGSMTLRLGQAGSWQLQANVVSVGEKVQGALEQTRREPDGAQSPVCGTYVGGSTGTYTIAGAVLDAANSYVGNLRHRLFQPKRWHPQRSQ